MPSVKAVCMWCANMPHSHTENICTHEDAMSDLVCGEKKDQISDPFIHFISDFFLFEFPSHKSSLSLFSRSLCTSTFYPPHFLCCRHLFSFHLAFPHIVLLFVINLPHVICACFSCCFSSVKKAPFFYIIKLLYYYCLTGVIRVLPGKMESFSHLFEWRLNREAKMAHSTWPTWKKFWGTSDGDKSIWREDLTCYKVRKSVSV